MGGIDRTAASVEREVATVMKALAPMGGTKEQSDACIALGRLAAWAEAAFVGHYRIEMRDAD